MLGDRLFYGRGEGFPRGRKAPAEDEMLYIQDIGEGGDTCAQSLAKVFENFLRGFISAEG